MGKVTTKEGKKKKKKKEPSAGNGASGSEGKAQGVAEKKEAPKPFTRPEIFSKPKDLQVLFQAFRDGDVGAEVLRPRLQTESVEHGRGTGILRNFAFRKFKEEPKAVVFMNTPRSKGGGAFEPTDRLLTAGEQIRLTYTTTVEGADRPIYFLAKGFFLRKAFLVPDNPQNPGKPWTGTREEAEKKFNKDVMVGGDDIMELRIDVANSFPGGPGRTGRDVLDRYISDVDLFVIPTGAAWNQKSTQGNFFDTIRDPLEKYIEKEDIKILEKVTLDEFSNTGELAVLIKERLLADIEHEVARPTVIKKPNDFIGEIDSKLGFLLRFKVDPDIGEAILRTFPKKAGKSDEIFLPLILEQVADSKEQFRVTFTVFPRDLIQETSRKSMERGLKFMPHMRSTRDQRIRTHSANCSSSSISASGKMRSRTKKS